jgi:hypothetical protein
VDGVWEAGRVVDYEADGRAGAKVVDVPLEQVSMGRQQAGNSTAYFGVKWVRIVSAIRKQKNWRVVIAAESYVVHCPDRVTRRIRGEANGD